MPNITITGWRALRKPFDIPVDIDSVWPFCTALKPATSVPILSKPINAWIVNASRILHISGGAAPVFGMEADWQNILRWECSVFWEINHASLFVETVYKRSGQFAHEHAKRSGEYLAMGAALTLLDASGIASPSHVYFLDHTGARPDFVVAAFTRAKTRIHIEARSRGWFTNIGNDERADLIAKKGSVGGPTLVVYFQHGVGRCQPRKRLPSYNKTRLFVADPSGDEITASTDEVAAAILRNYLRVFRDIDLWYYSRIVEMDLSDFEVSKSLPVQRDRTNAPRWDIRDMRHPNEERYGDGTYVGRFFSSLLAESQSTSKSAALSSIEQSGLGSFSYRGVKKDVLDIIFECRWEDLITFSDVESTRDHTGATITSDGVVDDTTDFVEPDSVQARLILKSLEE